MRALQFIRIEDIAYDRTTPNMSTSPTPASLARSRRRGPAPARSLWHAGLYPNGRLLKMVLDPDDPLLVQSLSVLFDSDALGYDNPAAIHNRTTSSRLRTAS